MQAYLLNHITFKKHFHEAIKGVCPFLKVKIPDEH
jgi:hypothetical protein